ncbi:hypothetical protein KHO60_gp011 [Mycobacterium phage CharlieB]|uniref:Uncharacterized protein n=1 Tax=Mycobacterium phage CharlieB TaxID=2301609 RepID=A0A3G3BZ01_9CAUD|nr:hypothetical protein KHO60_gp011 [Mycobacterium phage CharlieB]AYP69437.1 hypothetical protein SEA_CHARLIEB_11 [Mycobacterium phage CharlieB]
MADIEMDHAELRERLET